MNKDAFTLGYMNKEAGMVQKMLPLFDSAAAAAKKIMSVDDLYDMSLNKMRPALGKYIDGIVPQIRKGYTGTKKYDVGEYKDWIYNTLRPGHETALRKAVETGADYDWGSAFKKSYWPDINVDQFIRYLASQGR